MEATLLLLVTVAVLVVPVLILFPLVPAEASDALQSTHSKLGVPPSQSSLGEQTQRRHDGGAQPDRRCATVQSLLVYPVKSCRGIEVRRSKVLPKGFEYDRLYAFARRRTAGPEWEVVTLRQLPLLANVRVDVWLPDETKHDSLLGRRGGSGSGSVVVSFPWRDAGLVRGAVQWAAAKLRRGMAAVPEKQFVLPLDFPSVEEIDGRGYRREDVQFFTLTVPALNMGPEVPPELAVYLGASGPLSLFRMDPSRRRDVLANAPRKEIVGFQPVVDFQDQYPLHLLNLTSARALENKIQKDETLDFLDAMRFRPNIIVTGLPEYDEDDWRSIRARSTHGRGKDVINFDVSCRTVRCKLPNVDPATGIRHKREPDATLRKHREIDRGAPNKGCFGMQLCPLFPQTGPPSRLEGFLEVGMEIDVLERGPHFAL